MAHDHASHRHGHAHGVAHVHSKNARRIFIALLLTGGFMFAAVGLARAAEPRGPLIILTSFPESLFGPIGEAFESRFPRVKVRFRSKKTSAAVSFVEERTDEPVDVFWASAPDAFEVLASAGHLEPAFRSPGRPVPTLGGFPLDDPAGYYRGFAISGYGIVWNSAYLRHHDLVEPASWTDLARREYAGHVALSAPSRSGTTHVIVEILLQGMGWDDGWATLLEIGGNVATITARSFGVLEGVQAGRFGVGASIDFLGLSARATGADLEFTYPPGTAFLPANAAIVERAGNPEAARAFVGFLLSDQGQRMLFSNAISRLPIRPELYLEAPAGYPNPFEGSLITKAIDFDVGLSRRRYQLVNALFDTMITYTLPSLKRTWSAIHEAEIALEGRASDALKARILEARRIASRVPLTAVQTRESALANMFVRRKPGLEIPARQQALEDEWRRLAQQNQVRALQLAREVLDAVPPGDSDLP